MSSLCALCHFTGRRQEWDLPEESLEFEDVGIGIGGPGGALKSCRELACVLSVSRPPKADWFFFCRMLFTWWLDGCVFSYNMNMPCLYPLAKLAFPCCLDSQSLVCLWATETIGMAFIYAAFSSLHCVVQSITMHVRYPSSDSSSLWLMELSIWLWFVLFLLFFSLLWWVKYSLKIKEYEIVFLSQKRPQTLSHSVSLEVLAHCTRESLN